MTQSLLDTLSGTNGTASATVTVTPLPVASSPSPTVPLHRADAAEVSVIPYDARFDPQADAFLSWMWKKMQDDDLVDYYFPGQKETGFATFARLMSGDAKVALLATAIDSNQWEDRIAGFITWTPMQVSGDVIIAGFIFFRKFWDQHVTDAAGAESFKYWFTETNTQVVLGVCPEPHKAAIRYNKRIGLKETGRIPQASTFKGEHCDAILYAITKDEWLQRGHQ